MQTPLVANVEFAQHAPRIGTRDTDGHVDGVAALLQDAHGGNAKKWLVLNVGEAGSRKKDPIGRVVIDLSEFAALDAPQVCPARI